VPVPAVFDPEADVLAAPFEVDGGALDAAADDSAWAAFL